MPCSRGRRSLVLTALFSCLICRLPIGAQTRIVPSPKRTFELRTGPKPHDYAGTDHPNLMYFGGALIAHASYSMVYWGPYWTSGFGLSQRKQFTSFVQAVAPSAGFAGMFAEYQEPANPILAGSFGGEILIPTAPGASTDDTALQSRISAWITATTLPVPDANTVYVIMFPPGADVTFGGQSACGKFFGYHGAANSPSGTFGHYRYIVLPYQNCGGDLAIDGPIAVNGMTDTLGHEMSEVETDPDDTPGWYDYLLHEEMADICADTSATFGFLNFWMQKVWSDSAGTCIAPASGSPSLHLTISAPVVNFPGNNPVPSGAANVLPGDPTTFTISTDSTDPVSLSISDMPPGVTYNLSHSTVTATATATLQILTDTSPGPAGTVTVTATQNSQEAQFQILVVPWKLISAVTVTNSSFVFNSAEQAYAGTITLQNTGTQPLGPTLLIGFHGLAGNIIPLSVGINNATSYVEVGPNGDSMLQFPDGMLAPGSSVVANVAFSNRYNLTISFTPQIFEIQSGTSCDLTRNGFTSVADAQLIINEALGAKQATDDLNSDGEVNVVDVEIVLNSALNLGCPSMPH